jgi:hypothetical protein
MMHGQNAIKLGNEELDAVLDRTTTDLDNNGAFY